MSVKELQTKLRAANDQAAEAAAEAVVPVLLKVAHDAMTTEDPDVRRKALETLHRVALSREPKAPTDAPIAVNFQIVLDGTPQVAPTRLKLVPLPLPEDVEDAVLVARAPLPQFALPVMMDVDD